MSDTGRIENAVNLANRGDTVVLRAGTFVFNKVGTIDYDTG